MRRTKVMATIGAAAMALCAGPVSATVNLSFGLYTSNKPTAMVKQFRPVLDALAFAPPVTHVYNPLRYAREIHEEYLARFGGPGKRAVFVGMNPGPWGMAQTGVPFGEVAASPVFTLTEIHRLERSARF